MKKLLFLLMLITVAATAAIANNGDKKNGDKPTDNGAKAKAKATNRLEEFIWTLPQSTKVDKVEDADMQKVMVDLYKWYLKNETRLNNMPASQIGSEDAVVAPFKVDPKVLQQYLKFIKMNFPGLNEDDLADDKTAVTKKKSAPVTYRDDLDAPISVSSK